MPANDPARAQRMRGMAVEAEASAAQWREKDGRDSPHQRDLRLRADALRLAAAVIAPDEATVERCARAMLHLACGGDTAQIEEAMRDYRDEWLAQTRAALAALAGTPSAPDEGEKEQR